MTTVNHEQTINYLRDKVGTDRWDTGIHGVKYEGTELRDYSDEDGTGTVVNLQVTASDINLRDFRKAGIPIITIEWIEELEQYELLIGTYKLKQEFEEQED